MEFNASCVLYIDVVGFEQKIIRHAEKCTYEADNDAPLKTVEISAQKEAEKTEISAKADAPGGGQT